MSKSNTVLLSLCLLLALGWGLTYLLFIYAPKGPDREAVARAQIAKWSTLGKLELPEGVRVTFAPDANCIGSTSLVPSGVPKYYLEPRSQVSDAQKPLYAESLDYWYVGLPGDPNREVMGWDPKIADHIAAQIRLATADAGYGQDPLGGSFAPGLGSHSAMAIVRYPQGIIVVTVAHTVKKGERLLIIYRYFPVRSGVPGV
jgi:hypothetical protein